MKDKRVGNALCLVALAAIWVVVIPVVQASERCSTASVAGGWGLTLTGTLILPTGGVPAAAIVTWTVDKNGTITTGTESRNVGGGYADETITGYWTVNPDCTGTLYANVYQAGILVRISVASITFDDDSAQARMVQKSLQLPDGTYVPVVITLEGRKQHSDL